jgi:hypothetical protein
MTTTMAQSATSINTHQDLVEYDEIFKGLRVDDETGMVSVNDTLDLFGISKNSRNTYYKKLKNKIPNIKWTIKQINNKGQKVILIHPSFVLQIIYLIRRQSAVFLSNKLNIVPDTTHNSTFINTHKFTYIKSYKDLVEYNEKFKRVSVDKETGMISLNDALDFFGISKSNRNTYIKRLNKRIRNLKVVIKQINNKGQKVKLIHPSDVLQILLHTNVPSVKTFLNGKIQQLQSDNDNILNIEKITETNNEEIKSDVNIQELTETNLDSYELKEEPDNEEIGPELSTYTEEESINSIESTESNTILNNLEQYKNIPKSHYMYIVLNPETFKNTRQVKIGRAANIRKLVR